MGDSNSKLLPLIRSLLLLDLSDAPTSVTSSLSTSSSSTRGNNNSSAAGAILQVPSTKAVANLIQYLEKDRTSQQKKNLSSMDLFFSLSLKDKQTQRGLEMTDADVQSIEQRREFYKREKWDLLSPIDDVLASVLVLGTEENASSVQLNAVDSLLTEDAKGGQKTSSLIDRMGNLEPLTRASSLLVLSMIIRLVYQYEGVKEKGNDWSKFRSVLVAASKTLENGTSSSSSSSSSAEVQAKLSFSLAMTFRRCTEPSRCWKGFATPEVRDAWLRCVNKSQATPSSWCDGMLRTLYHLARGSAEQGGSRAVFQQPQYQAVLSALVVLSGKATKSAIKFWILAAIEFAKDHFCLKYMKEKAITFSPILAKMKAELGSESIESMRELEQRFEGPLPAPITSPSSPATTAASSSSSPTAKKPSPASPVAAANTTSRPSTSSSSSPSSSSSGVANPSAGDERNKNNSSSGVKNPSAAAAGGNDNNNDVFEEEEEGNNGMTSRRFEVEYDSEIEEFDASFDILPPSYKPRHSARDAFAKVLLGIVGGSNDHDTQMTQSEVQRMVDIVQRATDSRKLTIGKKYNQTEEEVFAIVAYTSDSKKVNASLGAEHSFYHRLNFCLGRRATKEFSYHSPMLDLFSIFITALQKIEPKRNEVVYRSVGRSVNELSSKGAYERQGVRICWPGVSSTSSECEQAFAFMAGQAKGSLMKISVSCAYPVHEFSAFPYEKELLLMPNTVVRVDAIRLGVSKTDPEITSLRQSGQKTLLPGKIDVVDLVQEQQQKKNEEIEQN